MRLAGLFVATASMLIACAPADAYYGNAEIVSADLVRLEQGDDTSTYGAISGDGHFVALQTRARNFFADDDPDPPGKFRVGGIFRRDLNSPGSLQLVADGDLRDEQTNEILIRGAQSPSISENGRYVAFSSAWQLVPDDTNDNIDVYVRDMEIPIRSTGAFELVSAKDGGNVPASYAPRDPPLPGRNPGAETTRGAAISADGSKVVFRAVDVSSDLPDRPSIDTPANQVFVRDLQDESTALITRTTGAGSPAGGAVGPAGISADGSTVIWTGRNAQTQTSFLNGEFGDPSFFYYLWKRIADGPDSAARRVTGAVDVDDPACPPGATVGGAPDTVGPCYGPLTVPEQTLFDISAQLPGISADGYHLAFVTGSGPRPNVNTGLGLDVYLTDMSPGVSRKKGTVELTREGVPNDPAQSTPINGLAMSSDGRHLALVTARTSFALPLPTFTGSAAIQPDYEELYAVDLAGMKIERVSRASEGTDINSDASVGATLSNDGARMAFAASASNLFYGDANERADVFAATRGLEPPPEDPLGDEPVADPSPAEQGFDQPAAQLAVSIKRTDSGALRLTIRVPRAGLVKAQAKAASRPRRARKRSKGKATIVARASTRVRAAGQTTLLLKPSKRYRKLIGRGRRIETQLLVSFTPSDGGKKLTTEREATFRR